MSLSPLSVSLSNLADYTFNNIEVLKKDNPYSGQTFISRVDFNAKASKEICDSIVFGLKNSKKLNITEADEYFRKYLNQTLKESSCSQISEIGQAYKILHTQIKEYSMRMLPINYNAIIFNEDMSDTFVILNVRKDDKF